MIFHEINHSAIGVTPFSKTAIYLNMHIWICVFRLFGRRSHVLRQSLGSKVDAVLGLGLILPSVVREYRMLILHSHIQYWVWLWERQSQLPDLVSTKMTHQVLMGQSSQTQKWIATETHRLHPHADSPAARNTSRRRWIKRSICEASNQAQMSSPFDSCWLDFGGCVWSLKGTLGIASKCHFNGEKNGEAILQTNHHSFQVVCCELDSRLPWFIVIHHAEPVHYNYGMLLPLAAFG